MKFIAVISSRYHVISSSVHCRSFLIPINRFGTAKLVNGAKQRPTVGLFLPKLCGWLDCSQSRAEKIRAQISKQECFNVETVEERVDFLKQNGVAASIILDHPWLLLFPLEDMKEKMKILHKVGVVLDTIPLLRLPRGHLKSVVNHWLEEAETFSRNYESPTRLHFFADRLHCSCYEVSMLMERHYYLLTMDLNRVARIMHLLLESGIPSREIKNDLWIFGYSEELIYERIERAKEACVNPIKIWMLRCEDRKFTKKLKNWTETQKVLGSHEDADSYLAERLKCSKADVYRLHAKYKKFSTISVLKLKTNLDFLFECGFTPEQVRDAPRVLGHSLSTLARRFEELKTMGYPYITIRMLFTTASEYERLINKIQQAKLSRDKLADIE